MKFCLRAFLLFCLCIGISELAYSQANIPLELPKFSADELNSLEVKAIGINDDLTEVTDKIEELESSRKNKKTNLILFKIPCCGKADLPEEKERELRALYEKRDIKTAQLIEATSVFRGAIGGNVGVDEAKRRIEGSFLNLVGDENLSSDNVDKIYAVAKKRKIAFKKYFVLPDEVEKKISYFKFKATELPNGATLALKGSGETSPLIYTGSNLKDYSGNVGPILGETITVEIIYDKNTSKRNLIFIDDILVSWSGTKKVDRELKGAIEQSAETAGPACGGTDNRKQLNSIDYPFVGRIIYGQKAICTGFILENDLVITAGHCLTIIKEYNVSENGLPDYDFSNVHFELQVSPKSSIWGEPIFSPVEHRFRFAAIATNPTCENCSDTKIFDKEANPPWSKAEDYNIGTDWAVLKIIPATGSAPSIKDYRKKYKLPKIRMPKDENAIKNLSSSAFILGYGKHSVRKKTYTLQSDQGSFNYIPTSNSPTQKAILTYGIHTQRGTSGAPVLVNFRNKYYAVGVHTHGFCDRTETQIGQPINVGMPFLGKFADSVSKY